MNIIDKLELLKYGDRYRIEKEQDGFRVDDYKMELGAFIKNNGEIEYYRTGCYDSGCDWLDIDLKAFKELEEFCNILKGE